MDKDQLIEIANTDMPFGKYKGRINNYLSKRGYNITKERAAWAERLKAKGVKL